MDCFIPRRLTYEADGETHIVADADLLTADAFQDRPLVVLGEAGSGKSRLLAERRKGALLVRAAQVLADPSLVPARTGLVLVDAVDEVAAQAEGDAIDRLLAILRNTEVARFVLACRVADWRSETAKAAIETWVGMRPIELRIEPLNNVDAERYLAATCGLGDAKAAEIV
jgi:predicted NACHT family NTPase